MSGLLTLEEAQARLLALAPQMPLVETPTQDALRRVLVRDLTARRTQPTADLSAMDGYAIAGDGPWQRVGESRAGTAFDAELQPGECTRISTGAHMPAGADRVLIQENAIVEDAVIALAPGESLPEAGRHVRRAGFDFAQGDTLLSAGTMMGAAHIALALSGGHETVAHRAIPRVAVLDSGDELTRNVANCTPDQIPASNGPMLAAMLAPLVGSAQMLGPVPDDRTAFAKALDSAQCDVLITSGGASVGDHDLTQAALEEWGAAIDFWKVAIKPGKPLLIATREAGANRQVILGLPGNPVSTFVTAFLFALPLVRAMLGHAEPFAPSAQRMAAQDLPASGKRREFLRAVSDGQSVRLAASQDSSALRALASANCLIERPPGAKLVRSGDLVPVYNLQNGGIAGL